MRVGLKPFRNWVRTNVQHLANPKQAKEDMKVWRVGTVSVRAVLNLDLPKPAKEEKDVIQPHALRVQVTLGGAILPKGRQPPGLARPAR